MGKTTQEVCTELGLTYSTVWNMLRLGQVLPLPRKKSNGYVWTEEDVDRPSPKQPGDHVRGFAQVGHIVVSTRRLLRRGFHAVAGAHQERRRADGKAQIHIARLVADHEGLGGVEIELGGCVPHHARPWLAAFAVVRVDVRAVVDAGERHAAVGQELPHARGDGIERGAIEIAARQARLVADDRQAQPQLLKSAQARQRIRQQLHAGGVGEVMPVDDDRAVAIENGKTTTHNRSPELSLLVLLR